MDREITVNPKTVVRVLGALIALLMMASVTGQAIKYLTGHDHVFGFVPKSYVGKETTIPTYFSSLLFLASSVLLAVIAKLKITERDRFGVHWAVISALFLCLSLDDSCGLHELAITPMQRGLGTSGLFYFAWVIPALLIVAVLVVLFFKFVAHLPRRTRYLVVTAAAFCLGGGIGFEMIGGRYVQRHSAYDPTYLILVHVEELLEMIGLSVFIFALLEYIAKTTRKVVFQFEPSERTKNVTGVSANPTVESLAAGEIPTDRETRDTA